MEDKAEIWLFEVRKIKTISKFPSRVGTLLQSHPQHDSRVGTLMSLTDDDAAIIAINPGKMWKKGYFFIKYLHKYFLMLYMVVLQ